MSAHQPPPARRTPERSAGRPVGGPSLRNTSSDDPSQHDSLTGLPTRRWFENALRDAAWRARMARSGPFTIHLVGLDRFDRIVTACGRTAADRSMADAASLLRNTFGARDSMCRLGESELCVVQSGARLARGRTTAESLRSAFAGRPIGAAGRAAGATLSIGLVDLPGWQLGPVVVDRAQEALAAARCLGGNRVCTWEMALFEQAVRETGGVRGVELRLAAVLTRCGGGLGPTQKDHLTDHSVAVSRVAVRLAIALAAGPGAADDLRIAGLCHDLGKLLVPEDVLAKPGPLDEEERALLSCHAQDGADMTALLGASDAVTEMIRHHHHRFDLADSAAGAALPALTARILSVADAVVAMLSDRPYQSARSFDDAMRELRRCAGSQFDPRIVEIAPSALRDLASQPNWVAASALPPQAFGVAH